VGQGARRDARCYKLLEQLTGGGMAEAYRGVDEATQAPVFVKRALGTSDNGLSLERETRIYEKLNRTEADCFMGVLAFERAGDSVFLVTAFADGGDLDEYLRETPPAAKELPHIATSIADALAVLHGHGVVHRDIKPQNVLIHQGTFRLTDFGISKNLMRLITKHTMQGVGTLGYIAPEQLKRAEAHPSADIYSFGRLLDWDLIPPGVDRSADWRSLIADCTANDPDERPTIDAVLARLRLMK